MQIERVEQKVRLMAHTLLNALILGLIIVRLEDGLVDGMSALVDDDLGPLAGAQTPHVSEADLSNDNVEVMFSLVDVRAHGNDAADTIRIVLARPGRGSMHDGVLGGAEEISGATDTVEHAAAHDAGAVGVGVDVDLDGGVHADDTETADDLGRVGHALATEEELVVVLLPVIVEALEGVGREANRRGGGEVELTRVEEVEEGVLDDLGPHLEVAEVAVVETADDSVSDVADAGLKREEVLGEAAAGDFVLEELDEVAGDGLGLGIGRSVGRGRVGVVGLDDADDLFGVDGDGGAADAVLDVHDKVGLAVGGQVGHGDIVETLEGGDGGVDLDDDLLLDLAASFLRCQMGQWNPDACSPVPRRRSGSGVWGTVVVKA